MKDEYRIVMIGPNGERDYVDHIFDGADGLPCLGGEDPTFAGLFPKADAETTAEVLRKKWLYPHVAVELEPVQNNAQLYPDVEPVARRRYLVIPY